MSPSDFLTIIQSLPKSQSGFPTKESIAKATHFNVYNVKLMLAGLVKNGKLRMEGNWYKFNEIQVTEKQVKDYIEAITEENKHESIETTFPNIEISDRFKNKDYIFTILRTVMLIIGMGSAVISAYYTQIWQHETLNTFWSWFLSLIMIGFSSAAFLTLISILTKSIHGKFSTWLLAGIFFVLWIICLLYSISVTVAGRYAQYQEIVLTNQMEENNHTLDTIKISNILDNIKSLKLERDNNQKRLNTLFLQADAIQKGEEVKGETWLTIQSRILNVQGIISTLNKDIENKNAEYEKIAGSSVIISKNESKFGFYDWVASIYNTDRKNVEWFMVLFPSLFLDIASPIALAVFMFLGRRKEDEV